MLKYSEICNGRFFSIPENQRGFSWKAENVEDFIEDLLLAGSQSHYMGPLIVSRTSLPDFQDDSFSTTAEYTLEDGQQRLTTLFIFANEIRKLFQAKNIHHVEAAELEKFVFMRHQGVKLRLQNKQSVLHDYLSYILTGSPAQPAARVPAMNSLDEVRSKIFEVLNPLSDQDLLHWKQRICNQALFVWVDLVTAGVNRYLTFDAINSRGLPLSEFDKIKNFCILVCSVRNLPNVDVGSQWFRALVELEKFGVNSRSNEADFITEIFSSYHGSLVSQIDVHTAFVKKYKELLSAANPALEADLIHFISLWQPYAKSFAFLSCRARSPYYGTLCNHDAGTWLDRIDNMGLPTITRPILAASHLKMQQDDFAKLCKISEIYTFRVYALNRKRKDTNASKIITLAGEILRGGKSQIQSHLLYCQWIQSLAPREIFIKELGDGKPKYAFDPNVSGWPYCYYFLYEYELSVSPAGVAPIPYQRTKELVKNQQEHILPQAHRDGTWWQSKWPSDSAADQFKHRLGNLVLTSNNQALGRKSFPDKLNAIPPNHCYNHSNATNSEKKISQYSNGVDWLSDNIVAREFDLIKFALTRWHSGCACDNGLIPLTPEFSAVNNDATIDVQNEDIIESELPIDETSLSDESDHTDTLAEDNTL